MALSDSESLLLRPAMTSSQPLEATNPIASQECAVAAVASQVILELNATEAPVEVLTPTPSMAPINGLGVDSPLAA